MMDTNETVPSVSNLSYWLPRALRIWGVASLGMLLLMLTHKSDTPTFMARYSTLIMGLLVAMLMASIAAHAAAFYLARRPRLMEHLDIRLKHWRERSDITVLVVSLSALTTIGLYLFFLGDHLPTYAAIRAFMALSILIMALALLTGGAKTAHDSRIAWPMIILPAIAIPITLMVFASTVMPPLLKADEAFTLSMGINLRDFGMTAPLIYKGIYADQYAWGGIWLRGLALWIQVFGDGLAQGRHYMFLVGVLSVVLTWIATMRLYDRATAWCTALIMTFMILRLGYLRPDMFVAFYLSVALVAYSWAQRHPHPIAYLATGFFVGLCIDAAPIAYVLGVAFALLHLWRAVQNLRQRGLRAIGPFLALAMGGALAIGAYSLTRSGMGWFPGSSLESDYISAIALRVRSLTPSTDLNTLFTSLAPLTLLAFVGGTALLLPSANNCDRGILAILIIWLCLMLFVAHYFPPFYAVHGVPLLAVLAGLGVTRGMTRWLGVRAFHPAAVTILLTIWLSAWTASWSTRADTLVDVVEAGHQIAEVLPVETIVVGAEPYYFGMLENFRHTFRGGAFEQTSAAILQRSPEQTWTTLAPAAIIFSQHWPQEPARTPALLTYMRAAHYRLIGCWQTTAYGLVEVWGSGSIGQAEHLANCLDPTATVGD